MGNPQNRKRKKKRIPPSNAAKKFKDGEPAKPASPQNPGPSEAKLGNFTAKLTS